MAKITFNTSDGQSHTVEGSKGTIMELAVKNRIKGIDGDCGGVCSCATCHVFVNAQQLDLVGSASEIERDMLELDDSANEFSRLGCQIDISEKIDGLILTVAK